MTIIVTIFKFLLLESIVLVFKNIISFNLHDTVWDRYPDPSVIDKKMKAVREVN